MWISGEVLLALPFHFVLLLSYFNVVTIHGSWVWDQNWAFLFLGRVCIDTSFAWGCKLIYRASCYDFIDGQIYF